jgi:hypothetical protein
VTASIPLILVFLALSSVCLGYLIVLQSEIASLIPDNMRGRLFGIAAAILELAQGGAIFVAGAAAAIFDVPVTLIAAGVVGAVVLTIAGTRMARSTGPRSAYDRPRGQ